MNCSVSISENSLTKELKKRVGDDNVKFNGYLTTVFNTEPNEDGEFAFNDDFINWYKSKTNNKTPNLNVKDARNLADRIIEYYNYITKSTDISSKTTKRAVVICGYNSYADRSLAINIASGFILQDVINESRPSMLNIRKNKPYYYWTNILKRRFADYALSRIANKQGRSKDDVTADGRSSKDQMRYLIDNLSENSTTSDKNLIAVLKELSSSEALTREFIADILMSDKLKSVNLGLTPKQLIDNDSNTSLAAEDKVGENEVYNPDGEISDVLDSDTYLLQLNSKEGLYSTWTKHINAMLLNYFNALPKKVIDEAGNVQDDTNNALGIPETMDAVSCILQLKSAGHINNIGELIDTAELIAKNVAGFEAFKDFANELRSDKNFAFAAMTSLAKTVIPKTILGNRSGKYIPYITNNRTTTISALVTDMSDNATAIINSIEKDTIVNQIQKIKDSIKSIHGTNDTTDNILLNDNITYLTNLLRTYFPTLSEKAIETYVRNNDNAKNVKDRVENIRAILTDIQDLINGHDETINNYITIQSSLEHARAVNKEIAERRFKGLWVQPNSEINIADILNKSFLSKSVNVGIRKIASKLAPYSVANISMNSFNVDYNQVSDILNTSLITQIYSMINQTRLVNNQPSNPQLEKFAAYIFQDAKYKYDPVLLEQYDETGTPINMAIFREVAPNTYRLTEYADKVVNISLFSGTRNENKDTGISYADMSFADYVPTSFITFLNEPNGNGAYFLRTPSDKSNNYIFTAPKYETNDLYYTTNEAEINQQIDSALNSIHRLSLEELSEKYANINFIRIPKRNTKDFADYLLGKPIYIPNINNVQSVNDEEVKDGSECYTCIVDTNNDNKIENIYIFKGKLNIDKTRYTLTDTEIVGIANRRDNILSNEVYNYLFNKLRNDVETKETTFNGQAIVKADKVINEESQAYKLIFNIVKQELLGSAIALNSIFEFNDNGTIKFQEDGITPKFKEGFDNNSGYNDFKDKDGKILTKIPNGYQLNGLVFNSTRFTVNVRTVDENGNIHITPTNFLYDIIDKGTVADSESGRINLLYGGMTNEKNSANDNSLLHIVRDEHKKVVDIELTDKQAEIIRERLSKFISSYIDDIRYNINAYKNNIVRTFTDNDIISYAINSFITMQSYDSLFNGDSKYYGKCNDNNEPDNIARNGLKRAASQQASGNPYANVDYNEDLNNESKPITSVLDEQDTKLLFKGTMLQGLQLKSRFNAVTVANTKRGDDAAIERLVKELKKNAGMTEAAARTYLNGYNGVKVNDAESYITFDEWVRRIVARGQWNQYKGLIAKILDPTQELNTNDLEAFVQVQKNVYFDLYYDDKYGRVVPRFIKNAEFVLVPRFIKGTQLEWVYNAMKEAGIDQINTLETSKASNEKVLTLWDNEERITPEVQKSFVEEAKSAAKPYNYRYLYTQLDANQHMNDENKFAIQVSKKVIDGIPNDDEYKKDFFAQYCANIAESQIDLLKECGVECDSDGNIELDDDGNIAHFNQELFMEKMANQLMRTGINDNLKDFISIDDETGLPIMPMIMPNTLSKFESVFQSVFNNYITKQHLPGFHAEQVTAVGWKPMSDTVNRRVYSEDNSLTYHPIAYENNGKWISKETYDTLSTDEKKNYKKGTAPYIEVALPYSAFGIDKSSEHYKDMTDEEIIKELELKGIDKVIGYRIPTEGKQSIAIMKVKRFVSNALGSTIVVPNSWVAQTGSDFDIDSIYSIQQATYKNKHGEIKLKKYIENGEQATKQDYINYINYKANRYVGKAIKGELKEAIIKAKTLLSEVYYENNKELDDAWKKMVDTIASVYEDEEEQRRYIKKQLKNSSDAANSQFNDKRDRFINKLERFHFIVEQFRNNVYSEDYAEDKDVKSVIDDYLLRNERLQKLLKAQSDVYFDAVDENVDKILSEYKGDDFIPSFSDWKYMLNEEPIKNNTRDARNNKIFEDLLNMISRPQSLEENLARSNADEITKAINLVTDINTKLEMEHRSPYNPIDQAKFQEEVMSGAKLKGISVAMDSLCSICNTVHPTCKSIRAIYSLEDSSDLEKDADTFGSKVINGKLEVTHDKYGWNKNNRSIGGFILTAYSSQTTAYILDAVKLGSIPNCNIYTFPVLKHLVNLGINYRTAIGFIGQPAITRILNYYNKNKSIFSERRVDVINDTLKDIARDLGITANFNTPIQTVVSEFNKRYKSVVNDLFRQENDKEINVSLHTDCSTVPLISDKLINRIQHKGEFDVLSPVEENGVDVHTKELVFDFITTLQFADIKHEANEITSIARTLNPDKFGAKQTLFETNKVFDDLRKLVIGLDGKPKTKSALMVNGVNIVESIYPGISENDAINKLVSTNRIADSSYPSMYAFLKYATATSIVLSTKVLPTQQKYFRDVVLGFSKVFSGTDNIYDEKDAADFQNYVLGYYLNKAVGVKYPLHYEINHGNPTITPVKINEDNAEDIINAVNNERARICGYGYPANNKVQIITRAENGNESKEFVDLIINDVTNPTKKEIALFERLTPAQKVIFIQRNFNDESIFKELVASTYNPAFRGKYAGAHIIKFNKSDANLNDFLNLYHKALNSTNPLYQIAAIDLAKYAIVFEGFKMSRTGITRIIKNDVLLNELGEGGLGVITDVMNDLSGHGIITSSIDDFSEADELYENYLRSHRDTRKIRTLYYNKQNIRKYNIKEVLNGEILYIPYEKEVATDDDATAKNKYENKLQSMGITYKIGKSIYTNRYIKIVNNGKDNIYRIVRANDEECFLYPLNNLEENENATWSDNEVNNIYKSRKAYEYIIKSYIENEARAEDINAELSSIISKGFDEGVMQDTIYTRRALQNHDIQNIDFDINEEAKKEHSSDLENVITLIQDKFENARTEKLFVRSIALGKYMYNKGMEFASKQTIKMSNGYRDFNIYRLNNRINQKFLFLRQSDEEAIARIEQLRSIDERLADILKDAWNSGVRYDPDTKRFGIQNLYIVLPATNIADEITENSTTSSFVEEESASFVERLVEDFEYIVTNEDLDEKAKELTINSRQNGIFPNIKSIKSRQIDSIRIIHQYVNSAVDRLTHNFIAFVEDPLNPNVHLSAIDPRVFDEIKKDKQLERKYLRMLNEANALLQRYNHYLSEQIDSDDSEIKYHHNQIAKKINELNKLPINNAYDKYLHQVISSKSTNPLIRQQVIDIADNYWATSGEMYKFHDLTETGNPIVQNILKDVFGDLEARRFTAMRRVEEFNDKVSELEAAAKKEGLSIDWNKFIKNGRIVMPFIEKFSNDLTELRQATENAAAIHGRGSIEHLKAKLEYDKFKAKYVNQEAKDDYYKEKIDNEEHMIKKWPEIYEKYMKLYFKCADLYKTLRTDEDNEDIQKQIDVVRGQMRNLTGRDKYIDDDGNIQSRPTYDPKYKYDYDSAIRLRVYGTEACDALNYYIKTRNELGEKYYKYETFEGFQELVLQNLEIIESAEQRYNGIPTVSSNILEKNEAYVEAKKWLYKNARFAISFTEDGKGIANQIQAAFDYLHRNSNNKVSQVNEIIRKHNEKENIYDELGRVQADKLTDEEIDAIKEQEVLQYQVDDTPDGTDRILINFGDPNGIIYNKEFYNGLSGGQDNNNKNNTRYRELVSEANQILEMYLMPVDGKPHLNLTLIPDTEEGHKELQRLADIFAEIRNVKQIEKDSNDEYTNETTKNFIKENVEFVVNKLEFNKLVKDGLTKSKVYQDLLLKLLCETTANGEVLRNFDGTPKVNRLLFSYAKPKGNPGEESYDKFVNKERTEHIATLEKYYRKTITPYYYKKQNEMIAKGEKVYNEWFRRNHVFNTYTHTWQPLSCWIKSEIKYEEINDVALGRWKARNGTDQEVIDGYENVNGTRVYNPDKDMRNPNYKAKEGHLANYKTGSDDGKYDSKEELNAYEKQMRDLVYNTLINLSDNNKIASFFKKGFMPVIAKSPKVDRKLLLTELGKHFGIDFTRGANNKDFYNDISYDKISDAPFPLIRELKTKEKLDLCQYDELDDLLKSDKTINFKIERPAEIEDNVEENNKALAKWKLAKEKVSQHNNEVSRSLQDDNWLNVMQEYIMQASKYNAVLENKEKLYAGMNLLARQKSYIRDNILNGKLVANKQLSDDENGTKYETMIDQAVLDHYKTIVRRILWNQYKDNSAGKLTQMANVLQSFTSANYMILNLRGGIANVTLGSTGILAESFAKSYFGNKHFLWAQKEFALGIPSYFADLYSETASSKQSAFIKHIEAVDYDEINGVVRNTGLLKMSERVRNAGYGFNSGGEFMMQNTVAIAMAKSHKFVEYDDEIGYKLMNEHEYINYKLGDMLSVMLTEEQAKEFEQWKKKVSEDAGTTKDYAWFRKDILSEFVIHLNKEQQNEFIKRKKELINEIKEDFNKRDSLYDQIELGANGKLSFKEGSLLKQLDIPYDNTDVHKTDRLFGDFCWRVRKVNNKIHGVYNKIGAAKIEQKWYGALIMQYHKHLPMGILKRYLLRGHFDEFRGGVEKGITTSMLDLFKLNLRNVQEQNGLTDKETNTLKGFINIIKYGYEFATTMQRTWNIAPEYEKENIRRNAGDFIAVASALLVTMALYGMGGDDDNDDFFYNLALYEADRLASEGFMYNPIGLFSEAKKQASTPIAGQSIIADIFKSCYELMSYLFGGEDYNMTYQSGRFAGQNKLSVYIQRRIPIWAQINNLINIADNNHYYKVGKNVSTVVMDRIKD